MATESTSSRLFNSSQTSWSRGLRIVLPLWILAVTGGYFLTSSGCARRQEEKPNVPASPGQSAAKPEQKPAAQVAAKATKYTCPMHPTVISDKPGDCPICGMQLVPVKEEPNAPAPARPPSVTHEGTKDGN